MRSITAGALALSTMAVTGSAAAAQGRATPSLPQVTIPNTEVHVIHSDPIAADFEIWIARPMAGVMPLPDAPRKVLYLLDANLFFGSAVEMTRIMSQLYAELPPIVVVGIAYPTSDPGLQAELRARDFTPTADAGFATPVLSVPGAREPSLPEGERLGGAARFLKFLLDEVRPLVEELVDVEEGGSTLFGSSLGGLFVLYTLFEDPMAFDAYVAVSPAIWWDSDLMLSQEVEL